MTISTGSTFPDATLYESTRFEGSCPVGPSPVQTSEALRGKRVVIFAVPGAFTPTCSNQHLPGYVEQAEAFRAQGVDELWCIAANDGFVMASWGRSLDALGKVRMLGDGSAELAKKLGLELDLTTKGMGVRMQRFSAFVDDGVVKVLHVEAPGRFEVSDAGTMLKSLASLSANG
ncbi:MAG TPA: peroxiredoxin [Myxococcaceae bacterium]|nr:peroxiredoxin [Myxococcaceae bacterium]